MRQIPHSPQHGELMPRRECLPVVCSLRDIITECRQCTQPPCIAAPACLVWDTQMYLVFHKTACVTQAPLRNSDQYYKEAFLRWPVLQRAGLLQPHEASQRPKLSISLGCAFAAG